MKKTAIALVLLCAVSCKKKEESKASEPASADVESDTQTEPETTETTDRPAAKPEVLARGEYLMNLMGCQNCHTPLKGMGPDHSKLYAGGLEIKEEFGVWRSPNISMHTETGIGGWTDDQIADAIRLGKRPDGSQMYPIMPYPFYNVMSDDDVSALVAYMRTLPGIENKVEPTGELMLPKLEMPPAGGKAPDTSNAVEYGGYLASLMHCAACHVPMTEKGPDMSRAFAGGMKLELPPEMGTGVLYAANLTPHETGLKDWTDEEIINAVRMMKKKSGAPIMPPMAMYQGGWSQMTDEDAKSLAAFLRNLPPIENKVPESTFKMGGPPPAE